LRVSLPADTAVDNHIKYWDLEESFFEVAGTEGRWTVATNYTHCSWVKWATTDKEYHTLWFGSTSKYGSLNDYFLPRANERRRGVKSYGLGVPLVQGSLNGAFNNQQDQLQFLDPTATEQTQTGLEWQYKNRRRAKVDKSRWNFVCTVGYETSTGSTKSIFYMNLYPDFSHGEECDNLVSSNLKSEHKLILIRSDGLCGGTPDFNNFQDNNNLNDNIDYCRNFCAGRANVGIGGYFAYSGSYRRCECYPKSEGCPEGQSGQVNTGKGWAREYDMYQILAERDPNAPTFDDFGGLFPIEEFDWATIEPGAEIMRIGNAAQEPGKLAMYKSWNRAFSYGELIQEMRDTLVEMI